MCCIQMCICQHNTTCCIYICVPTESQKLATYFTTHMHVLQQKCSREQKMLTKLATYFTTRMYVCIHADKILLIVFVYVYQQKCSREQKNAHKTSHLFYYTYICMYSYIYANRNVHVNKKMLTKLATYFTTRMYVCMQTQYYLLYLCMCTNRNVHVNKKMLTKLAIYFTTHIYVCIAIYMPTEMFT